MIPWHPLQAPHSYTVCTHAPTCAKLLMHLWYVHMYTCTHENGNKILLVSFHWFLQRDGGRTWIYCLNKEQWGEAINKYLTDDSNLIKKIRNIFMYEKVLISRGFEGSELHLFLLREKSARNYTCLYFSFSFSQRKYGFYFFFLIAPVFLASCQVYIADFLLIFFVILFSLFLKPDSDFMIPFCWM